MPARRDVRPSRNPGVLIVDPARCGSDPLARALEQHGWSVWVAADAASAVATYALRADEIDVAVVEVDSPAGVRALEALREADGELSCCATAETAGPHAAAAFRRAYDVAVFTGSVDAGCLSFTLFEMVAPIGKRAAPVPA